MSHKINEPTVTRHLELYESDWRFLQEHFGRQSDAKLGVSVAIRQLVRKGIRGYQERLRRRAERAATAPLAATPGQSLDKFFASPLSPSPLPQEEPEL